MSTRECDSWSYVDTRFRIENRAGKLIEARVFRLSTVDEADEYGQAVIDAVAKRGAGAQVPVLCADHRSAAIYPPPVADRLVQLFRPNNSRFERIAILVSEQNATLLMQLERLTREAGFERRKVFRRPDGALAHLSASLDAAELARARSFLEETV